MISPYNLHLSRPNSPFLNPRSTEGDALKVLKPTGVPAYCISLGLAADAEPPGWWSILVHTDDVDAVPLNISKVNILVLSILRVSLKHPWYSDLIDRWFCASAFFMLWCWSTTQARILLYRMSESLDSFASAELVCKRRAFQRDLSVAAELLGLFTMHLFTKQLL